jgi:hypothetical protein
MLKLTISKSVKWIPAIFHLALAFVGIVSLGGIAFLLFGFVGAVGIAVVGCTLLLVGVVAVAEDERPGGFNKPGQSEKDAK